LRDNGDNVDYYADRAGGYDFNVDTAYDVAADVHDDESTAIAGLMTTLNLMMLMSK
jgi:hypothetical protein